MSRFLRKKIVFMKKFDITVPVKSLQYEELDDTRKHLVDLARQYTYRSYAPYSHFSVGAAIALDNGEVVCGANQENAAFSSGTCAERSACFAAGAAWPDAKFKCIAIAARGVDGDELASPIAPCGACRQSLLEYETLAGEPVEVLLVGAKAIYQVPSIKDLLPLAFTEIN